MKNRLLYPEIQLSHRVPLQIRFGDYDIFGHINNNSYVAYFDLGKTMFFNKLLQKTYRPADLSAAIVNINVDFLSPALMGEPLEVHNAVTHIGDRSFTVYQRVVNPLSGDVKAQATSVLAGFDVKTQGPAPLRDDLRLLLQANLLFSDPS